MTEKRPLTFTIFFLRLFSGVGGGVAGTLMALVVYFLMTALTGSADPGSISVFIVIVIGFVATLTANTATTVMVTFMDAEKYKRRKTMMMHVFLFNLALFFLTIPLYAMAVPINVVDGMIALHFILSAFISSIILEILVGEENSLLGLYSSALGVFIAIGIALLMLVNGIGTFIIIFGAMPFTWFILQINSAIVELIYDNFFRFYGVAALDAKTDLGGDVRAAAEEKAAEEKGVEEEDEEDEDEDQV